MNEDRPTDDARPEPSPPEPGRFSVDFDPEPVPVGAEPPGSTAASQEPGGYETEPAAPSASGRRPLGRTGSRARRGPSGNPGDDGGSGATVRIATRRVRELLATAVLTVAVLAALMLALGAVLVGLEANENNQIVSAVLDFAHQLDGPFADVFTFRSAVKQTLVNWGIAAAVYLIAGRVVERVIRP